MAQDILSGFFFGCHWHLTSYTFSWKKWSLQEFEPRTSWTKLCQPHDYHQITVGHFFTRSRFLRPDDDDDSAGNRKSMHFDDEDESKKFVKKERVKVSSSLVLLDENDPSYFPYWTHITESIQLWIQLWCICQLSTHTLKSNSTLGTHLHAMIRTHHFDFDIRFWPICARMSKT